MNELSTEDAEEIRLCLENALKRKKPLFVVETILSSYDKVHTLVDKECNTILHLACGYQSDLNVIKLICDKAPKYCYAKNVYSATPLHCACDHATDPEVIKYLIQRGKKATTMINMYGCTPLHLACLSHMHLEAIQHLVNEFPGALAIVDDKGDTPLHSVCGDAAEQYKYTSSEVVQYLVDVFPVACLLQNINAESPSQGASDETALASIHQILAQATDDVTCALIDVVFHSSTDVSPLIRVRVVDEIGNDVQQSFRTCTGQVLSETFYSQLTEATRNKILADDRIQGLLQIDGFRSVINGFTRMNKAGRSKSLTVAADLDVPRTLPIDVLRSVSDSMDCLFMHLRENPDLCEYSNGMDAIALDCIVAELRNYVLLVSDDAGMKSHLWSEKSALMNEPPCRV